MKNKFPEFRNPAGEFLVRSIRTLEHFVFVYLEPYSEEDFSGFRVRGLGCTQKSARSSLWVVLLNICTHHPLLSRARRHGPTHPKTTQTQLFQGLGFLLEPLACVYTPTRRAPVREYVLSARGGNQSVEVFSGGFKDGITVERKRH